MVTKKMLIILAVITLLGAVSPANTVGNKEFYSSGQILPGEQWNVVSIYDTPPDRTTVNMLGGLVDVMKTYDASMLNMAAGNTSTLFALESSFVNISGGFIHGLGAYENAHIRFFNDASAFSLGASDSTTIIIIGGAIENVDAVDSSIIDLYGGAITDHLGATGSSLVNIFGYDLVKTSSGGRYGYGQVSGFFNDGSAFTIDLSGSETYSHINLIPEPATFLLLVFGSMFLKKR